MSYERIKNLPVYRQALSLRTMSREIASYVTQNKDLLTLGHSNSLRDHIADSLLTDAILIPQHIARAENSPSLAIRQRSIHFINVMTRNLYSYCRGLEKDGVREREYLDLMRREVKHFRQSFKKWRKGIS
ncbi:hypothetical protein [Robiginitalea sp. SC105]|uniref:hypothetical protein n=1 Tax=Robiginitalea sp. SC105 TaxID=2762332 RepID=UPI00163ABD83|nr:hypothetical protein [Robiginitalea sp. SC105]MBC2839886.1 hypothetical protein [Robiginitalea sp. SC105]